MKYRENLPGIWYKKLRTNKKMLCDDGLREKSVSDEGVKQNLLTGDGEKVG